jgi:hypothetical protein
VVVGAVLTAALALVAAPGLAGSRMPTSEPTLEAAAFQAVMINATAGRTVAPVDALDSGRRSASWAMPGATFIEPGEEQTVPNRPSAPQPESRFRTAIKPPRYTLTGYASFYDNGTTAMRLPRGTMVRVCASGGCVERVINDYGPSASFRPVRIVDLMVSDFFDICGCPSYAGLTWVTVGVY